MTSEDQQRRTTAGSVGGGGGAPIIPMDQREYLLAYGGKQLEADVLLDTPALPFQRVRAFGPIEDATWHNMLIQGDNQPILRRLMDMKVAGELRNADGSDGVKLVYIDPPFASDTDYENKSGVVSYGDKVAGAEFIEGLRKRLVLIREVLADDGSVFVHLDWRKSHYIKVIMDEVFGEHAFMNEIAWCYSGPSATRSHLPRKHDTILFYGKGSPVFHQPRVPHKSGLHNTGQVFGAGADDASDDKQQEMEAKGKALEDWWTDIFSGDRYRSELVGYPTQKPERLSARIIKMASDPGDIVLDCFSGSGTMLAAAEKLERRWIGADLGLNSIYTIQKRLLNISSSQSLEDGALNAEKRVIYGQGFRPFAVYSSGHYDIHKLKALSFDEYRTFVLRLFGAADQPSEINAVHVDGRHQGDPVIVYDFKADDAEVTLDYIEELASYLDGRVGDRVLFIAPAASLGFLEDRVLSHGISFDIRRVPYSMVRELQKRAHQPVSEEAINKMVETVGFDFMIPPLVEFEIDTTAKTLTIGEFRSGAIVKGLTEEGRGFPPTLAMVLIDYGYDGAVFDLDVVAFAKDIEAQDRRVNLDRAQPGQTIAVCFCDIYGNERIEVLRDLNWGAS